MTAVEWLQERLFLSLSDELKCLNGFFVIAKEMEKEQIIDAFGVGNDIGRQSANTERDSDPDESQQLSSL